MTNFLQDPEGVCDLWRRHLPHTIGQKATDLFLRRTLKHSNWLVGSIIQAALYRPERGTYIPVSHKVQTFDRSHDWAEMIVSSPHLAEEMQINPLHAMTYFANELRISTHETWNDGSLMEAPSQRVSVGDHHIFTFEFDVKQESFLRRQVEWVSPKKNLLDCPMGDFYRTCSRYGDFIGMTACYGGHKSLHIHVVFSTAQAKAAFALGDRTSSELRRGFAAHWDRLHSDLLSCVDTDGHSADTSLKYAEAYRRLPGGTRVSDADHLLGIPEGTEIPQIVLWEQNRKRASGDQLPTFFSPEAFALPVNPRAVKRPSLRSGRVGPLSREQLDYCAERMKAVYPGWPRFADFVWDNGCYVALFWNSENDRKPSSFLREDFRTIQLCGRDAEGLDARSLPLTLGDLIKLWVQSMPEARLDVEPVAKAVEGQDIRDLERSFREAVHDKETAYKAMHTFFLNTACTANYPLMLVVGPEGVGKTTTLFRLYPVMARQLQLSGENPLGMFAFADYAAAAEKCRRFNAEQGQNGFAGVVLKSFSRTYEEACGTLGLRAITRVAAARLGYSHFDAIARYQPEVIARFREQHRELWAEIGGSVPVFFTVHQVMHSWYQDTYSRLMWAPSFWQNLDAEDAYARRLRLRKETSLGLAVHDEIKADHLVEVWPLEKALWAEKLVASDPAAWRGKYQSLKAQAESYDSFVKASGPVDGVGSSVIDFDEALQIVDFVSSDWRSVTTSDSGEYRRSRAATREDRIDIYEACHGKEWRAKERIWWEGLAKRTIVLTTERVPAALAAASEAEWSIFNLEAPDMPRTSMDVVAKRSVTSANLPEVCAIFREIHPDTYIVSNKVQMIVDTMPHVTARGSNDLIGKNLMQTMTFLPPQLYERLQVLNSWTGRTDLVGMHHIDEANQTAGRNLGFRHEAGVSHTLLINRSLLQLLVRSSAVGGSRYIWRLVLDKHQRSGAHEDHG